MHLPLQDMLLHMKKIPIKSRVVEKLDCGVKIQLRKDNSPQNNYNLENLLMR